MVRADTFKRAIKKEQEQIRYYKDQILKCEADIDVFTREVQKEQPDFQVE